MKLKSSIRANYCSPGQDHFPGLIRPQVNSQQNDSYRNE